MQHFQKHTLITVGLTALLLLVSIYFVYQQGHFKQQVTTALDQTQTQMQAMARELANNEESPTLRTTIANCPTNDQAQYDALLSKLTDLQGADLMTLRHLFYECAAAPDERRTIMGEQLQSLFQTYQNYVSMLHTLDPTITAGRYHVSAWQSLVDDLDQREQKMMDLVHIQGQIVEARVAGEPSTSDSIHALLGQAIKTKQAIIALNTQINAEKGSILGI